MTRPSAKFGTWFGGSVLTILLVAACSPSDAPTSTQEAPESESDSESAEEEYDLDSLIAAAKEEGQLTVYNTSSRVVEAGELFEAEYGIKVNATKIEDPEQAERIKQEVDSGNVLASVIGLEDATLLEADLFPQDYASTWFPPDMEDKVDSELQDPAIYTVYPRTWAYNTETYPDGCPIDNIWELTEDEWTGKFGFRDPDHTPPNFGYFSEYIANPEGIEEAYEERYEEPLETDEENAGWEFLKRFAANEPLSFPSDGPVSESVGAKNQEDPPMGMFVYTKFRDAEVEDLALGLCEGLSPDIGYASEFTLALVKDAPSPNAGKLFIRWLFTEEGVSPWTKDVGALSTNTELQVNEDDPYGNLEDWYDVLLKMEPKNGAQLNNEVRDTYHLARQ